MSESSNVTEVVVYVVEDYISVLSSITHSGSD
jgi:hypothetical protein